MRNAVGASLVGFAPLEVAVGVIFHQGHVPTAWSRNRVGVAIRGGKDGIALANSRQINRTARAVSRDSVTTVYRKKAYNSRFYPGEHAGRAIFREKNGLAVPAGCYHRTVRRMKRRAVGKPSGQVNIARVIQGDIGWLLV